MKCRSWLFAFGVCVILCNSCSLVSVDRKNILHIPIKANGVVIDVDYVAVGATSADVLQVTKILSNGHSEVLANLEPYDTIVNYNVKGDSIVRLTFCFNAESSIPARFDTIDVKIN